MLSLPLRSATTTAVSCLLVAAACSGGEPSTERLVAIPDTPPSLRVEVGTGTTQFVPLADGDVVDLTRGPQGGTHVWTSVRVRDAVALGARINLKTRFEGTTMSVGAASVWAKELASSGEGAREVTGLTNYVDGPDALHGRRIVLRAEIVTADGRHGEGERVVIVR